MQFALVASQDGFAGVFDDFDLPALDAGLEWALVTDAMTMSLAVVEAAGLAGDYNDDGIVERGRLHGLAQQPGRHRPAVQRNGEPRHRRRGRLSTPGRTILGPPPAAAAQRAIRPCPSRHP